MKRRILTLTLAVLLAVVGTAGVFGYVRGANNRAISGLKATTVLVAAKQIPAGTSASLAVTQGLLVRERLPVSSVPPDALASVPARLAALVTSADIQPGQLLLQPMLVPPQATGSLAVPAGKVGITIQLCLPEAVANYIQPGAWVEVFDTYTTSGQISGQSGCNMSQQQQPGAREKVVLPSVQIIKVGPASASQQGGQSARSGLTQPAAGNSGNSNILVTFAVTEPQAEQLILLNETGIPYLGLLSAPQPGTIASYPSLSKP